MQITESEVRQALEALEIEDGIHTATFMLKQALARPQPVAVQEAIGWLKPNESYAPDAFRWERTDTHTRPVVFAASTAPAAPTEPTYSSTQATNCAGCGEHKHTPLRIDAMGGYVCLTCIDKKLGSLLGEFGYPGQAAPKAEPVVDAEIECVALSSWNNSIYGHSERDCIHPMFLAAFISGYRAAEPTSAEVWLIEDQDHFPRHRWLRIVDAGQTVYLQWEHDANVATHFARHEDAVCFQKLHIDFCALSIVTEHLFIHAEQAAPTEPNQVLIDWVVERWHAEVKNRPMVNVHRRALDDTWRQMLRHLGVDDRERLGPTHDELRAKIDNKEWSAMNDSTEKQAAPIGHDGKNWPLTMDGKAWAEAFNQRFPAVSVDDALGWFCNAIMRGYDEANWRRDEQAAPKAEQAKGAPGASRLTDAEIQNIDAQIDAERRDSWGYVAAFARAIESAIAARAAQGKEADK